MRAGLAAALLLLALPADGAAAPELVPVGSFDSPVHVAAPPGDPSRLLVVEQRGVVRMVRNGQALAAPFLDVTDITATGGERGLLSIAFPPDYGTSGLFYYFVTAQADATPGGELGDLTVFEGRRAGPDRADPAYRRLVLRVEHSSQSNHNGGQLAFGRDRLLYVSTGDGGGQGDPDDNAQDPTSLLGKVLRVDTRSAAAPQVYALGLRNPWRFSFDRLTGDLVIGDVGGGINEEVDFSPAGAAPGLNYGWDVCEGDQPLPCPVPDAVRPALSLSRDDGYRGVIGGFVVRDPGLPTLRGRYVFADLARPTVMSAVIRATGGSGLRPEPTLPIDAPSSFGEDASGRIYVASLDGVVSRLHDPAPPMDAPTGPAAPGGPGAGGPAAVPQADRRAPSLSVRYRGTQRLRRLRVVLRADEACSVTVRARRFRTRRVALAAGARKVVRVKPTRRGLRRLRRATARRGRVKVTLRLAARDAAGNLALRRVRPGVVRRRAT